MRRVLPAAPKQTRKKRKKKIENWRRDCYDRMSVATYLNTSIFYSSLVIIFLLQLCLLTMSPDRSDPNGTTVKSFFLPHAETAITNKHTKTEKKEHVFTGNAIHFDSANDKKNIFFFFFYGTCYYAAIALLFQFPRATFGQYNRVNDSSYYCARKSRQLVRIKLSCISWTVKNPVVATHSYLICIQFTIVNEAKRNYWKKKREIPSMILRYYLIKRENSTVRIIHQLKATSLIFSLICKSPILSRTTELIENLWINSLLDFCDDWIRLFFFENCRFV